MTGPFAVIEADPPWTFETWSAGGNAILKKDHYGLVSKNAGQPKKGSTVPYQNTSELPPAVLKAYKSEAKAVKISSFSGITPNGDIHRNGGYPNLPGFIQSLGMTPLEYYAAVFVLAQRGNMTLYECDSTVGEQIQKQALAAAGCSSCAATVAHFLLRIEHKETTEYSYWNDRSGDARAFVNAIKRGLHE